METQEAINCLKEAARKLEKCRLLEDYETVIDVINGARVTLDNFLNYWTKNTLEVK